MLAPNALELLSALTGPIRVMSDHQVGRTLFSETASPAANARRLLRKLQQKGLVHLYRAPAHPEIPLETPVVSWSPGDVPPPLAHAAYLLCRRWTEPPVLTACVCATRAARNTFNGLGRRPREVELTHDLHLTAVYLRLRCLYPEDAKCWKSEDTLRLEYGELIERVPDAIVHRPGAAPRIIEFGGAYKKAKLIAFHRYCSERALAYEIW